MSLVLVSAAGKLPFLGALAAEVEAVYGGLKQFTVRMAAKNTTFGELLGGEGVRPFSRYPRHRGFHGPIKPDELNGAGLMRDLLKRHMFLDAVIVQLCCRIFIQCPEGGWQLFFCQNLSMGVLVKLFSSISNPVPNHPGEQAVVEAGRPVVSARGAGDGSTFRLNRPAKT